MYEHMTPFYQYSLNWNEGDLNAAKSGNIVIRYLMLNKHELTLLKKNGSGYCNINSIFSSLCEWVYVADIIDKRSCICMKRLLIYLIWQIFKEGKEESLGTIDDYLPFSWCSIRWKCHFPIMKIRNLERPCESDF